MRLIYFFLLTALLPISVSAQNKLVMKKYYNYTYIVEQSTNHNVNTSYDTILTHVNQISLPFFISSDESENKHLAYYIHNQGLDSDTFNMNTLNATWISALENKKPSLTKIYYTKNILSKDILSIMFYKNEYDCCQNSTRLSRQFNYAFTLDCNTNKVLLLKDVVDTAVFKKEYISILSSVQKDISNPDFYKEFISTIKLDDILTEHILLNHTGILFYLPVKMDTNKLKEYGFSIEYKTHAKMILPYIKKYTNNYPPKSYIIDVE